MRDWQAVDQPNGVYCAPACGCGCLRVEYEQAHQLAATLASVLKDGCLGNWEPRIWENCGWHWELVSGYWHLSPTERTRWQDYPKGHPERKEIVSWSCRTMEGPNGITQIIGRGDTPDGAIMAAWAKVSEAIASANLLGETFPGK